MPLSDLALALEPVVRFLRKHSVAYFVGGSVASSHHGAARSTLDVDLTVQLTAGVVVELVAELGNAYYLNEATIRTAIARKSCFNLVHLDTSFKVDVFVVGNEPFQMVSQQRAITTKFGEENGFEVRVASVEDILLIKLAWYRLGDESSERQWRDLTTLAKLHAERLDLEYLEYWAGLQGTADLLNRLLAESRV
ncbi:MAG: nucleotidyl transferase AbiEii/AbiGii toxin family protein [Aureliella sp.]